MGALEERGDSPGLADPKAGRQQFGEPCGVAHARQSEGLSTAGSTFVINCQSRHYKFLEHRKFLSL